MTMPKQNTLKSATFGFLRAVVVPLVQLLFIEYANDGSLEHVVDLIDVVFDIVDVVKPKRSNRQAQTQGQAQVED